MGNNEFGRFVKALREDRKFEISEDTFRHLTQEELGTKAGISPNIIRDIEQGKTVKLERHIKQLADAFELTDYERVAFYTLAGLAYPLPDRPVSKTYIEQLLNKLQYPATIRTPVWDIVAFNEYHRVFWGYSDEHLDTLNDGSVLGSNLLRVLFVLYDRKKSNLPINNDLVGVVWAFRVSSLAYVHTPRYKKIIKALSRYHEFLRVWDLSEHLLLEQKDGIMMRPFTKATHPEFGLIEFSSSRLPERYLGKQLIVSMYIPTPVSESNYARLRDRVTYNRVYFFNVPNLTLEE